MATAEYPLPDYEERPPAPLAMPVQLAVVALGTLIAVLAGIALVLLATG